MRKEFSWGKEAPEDFLPAPATEPTFDAQSGVINVFLPTTLPSFTQLPILFFWSMVSFAAG